MASGIRDVNKANTRVRTELQFHRLLYRFDAGLVGVAAVGELKAGDRILKLVGVGVRFKDGDRLVVIDVTETDKAEAAVDPLARISSANPLHLSFRPSMYGCMLLVTSIRKTTSTPTSALVTLKWRSVLVRNQPPRETTLKSIPVLGSDGQDQTVPRCSATVIMSSFSV